MLISSRDLTFCITLSHHHVQVWWDALGSIKIHQHHFLWLLILHFPFFIEFSPVVKMSGGWVDVVCWRLEVGGRTVTCSGESMCAFEPFARRSACRELQIHVQVAQSILSIQWSSLVLHRRRVGCERTSLRYSRSLNTRRWWCIPSLPRAIHKMPSTYVTEK